MERPYNRKYEYLRYCREMINYAVRNDLGMRTNVNDDDDSRLSSLCEMRVNETKSDAFNKSELEEMAKAFYKPS